MKFTSTQVRKSYEKAIAVIHSCLTNEQVSVADTYVDLFEKLYVTPIYTISWNGDLTLNEQKYRYACLRELRTQCTIKDFQLRFGD